MKKNVGPAKALAVVLSASLAMSSAVTASATTGENAASFSDSTLVDASVSASAEASTEDAASTDGDSSDSDAASLASSEVKNQKNDVESGEASTEISNEAAAEKSSVKSGEASSSDASVKASSEASSLEASDAAASSSSTEKSDGDISGFEKVDADQEGVLVEDKANQDEKAEIPVEPKDPDEQTRVIIVMEGDSVLDQGYDTEDLADNNQAMNLSENIIADQEETIEKISSEALDGEELEVNYNFSIITNAVSADVAYKDIENIVNVDGVEAVYVAQKYDPQTTSDPMTITSGDMVGSYSTWAAGYTGAGTRIAIIDTGIDADHPSFDEGAFEAHLSETAEAAGKTVDAYSLLGTEEIASVLPNLNASQRSAGLSADQLYVSEKIPFAFNYVDKNLDITHDNDDQGDHGTHVSGISTANYYVPDASSETGYSRQEVGVVGIAPDAQLITMKVFGTGGGAYSDDYMAAIEDAILLKADVINLSLGSSAAGYSSDSETYINEIFDKLSGSSTVVSISAGNSGRWSDDSTYGANLTSDVNQDTVGSPGSYTNAFTVASAVNSGLVGNYIETVDGKQLFFNDGSGAPAPSLTSLDLSGDNSGTEYPFVFIDGLGQASDYEGIDVTDKIVFVSRGAITFTEKHMNAAAAGAKAVIVYNNQAGTISMSLSGSTAEIPAASITLADALSILPIATKVSDTVYEGTISVSAGIGIKRDVADGYTMSDFSSYGVPGSLDLKPEITAPGGNIYSTTDDGTYGVMSGTSMAAPSISGQSALVEQYIRENDLAVKNGLSVRTLAQSLLMSTAIPLHEGNDMSAPEYSPRSQGAGLANIYNAVTSPSYILVGNKDGNDGKVKAVLGDDPERSGNYSFSFDIYNMTDEEQFYVLDSSVLTEQIYESDGLNFFVGSSHVLNPAVSLLASDSKLVYDLNEDGTVDLKDRSYLLKVVNGSATSDAVTEAEEYFDFNEDGVVNTKDVYLLGKQINGADSSIDLSLKAVRVKDSTRIDVQISLSDSDREYLAGFENGMYVDGFIYVNGKVDMSVPFLAFYGSWMDSSMYEPYDFMEAVHNPDYSGQTYCGISKTNFLSYYPDGDMSEENEYFYTPNSYVTDAEYIPDRNAISTANGTVIGSQYYSLIRNANRVIVTITDKNTDEVYFKNVEYENYASFVYQGNWTNYIQNQELNWKGTDAEGNALADGTEVVVTLEAVPSYYDNVEDPSTLTGKGLYMSTPLAIDNTAPELVNINNEEDNKATITVKDDRYTAAVLVIDKTGKKVLGRYAVNQKEKGAEAVVTIDVAEGNFYIDVLDYAGNESIYKVKGNGPKNSEENVTAEEENKEKENAVSTEAAGSTASEEKNASVEAEIKESSKNEDAAVTGVSTDDVKSEAATEVASEATSNEKVENSESGAKASSEEATNEDKLGGENDD